MKRGAAAAVATAHVEGTAAADPEGRAKVAARGGRAPVAPRDADGFATGSTAARAVASRLRKAIAATPPRLRPLRDATLAGLGLAAAIFIGSVGFANVDPALVGYLAATWLAWVASVYRASAFWRRPASALYARELAASLRRPGSLLRSLGHAGRDLAAQDFVRRRSVVRWLAHLALSLGTLASFAITVPLVFGWMLFRAEGDAYRLVVFGAPAIRFAVDGPVAWAFFHGLSAAGVAVALGATTFLVLRFRTRRLPGATAGFAMGPLVLLLVVALTGLALPASRGLPGVFPVASLLHEIAVVVLLVAIPFSKLGHVLVRPLQIGARAMRADGVPERLCRCGRALAPLRQQAGVARLLDERGFRFAGHVELCPPCRRRGVATAQARLVGASFQPRSSGVLPAPGRAPAGRFPAEER